jgi:nucleoside-diphosphate-sugar epimerase
MATNKILVTGAFGQIGTVLVETLIQKYGYENVVASDLAPENKLNSLYESLDILDTARFKEVIVKHNIKQIYHMAALLSAVGESKPLFCWDVNFTAFLNILELAKNTGVEKIFFPSSIAVFGPTTPQFNTPQESPLVPSTVYGVSKVAGELWANYYFLKYGLDVRSLRYPGIIGYQTMPGGGTTDYAVDIFHQAILEGHFNCFLSENTRLPMMYMEDAIRATIDLMEAPAEKLTVRYSYNLSAFDFTPGEIYQEIKKHIPDFTIEYQPDFRQAIADSWTKSIDDRKAREDWGWEPQFSLESMVEDMIYQLKQKYSK